MASYFRSSSADVSQAQSQADTLIPLLFRQFGSVQMAVDHATEIVRLSIQRLDTAENDILRSYCPTSSEHTKIYNFIKGCKYACTANLNWR